MALVQYPIHEIPLDHLWLSNEHRGSEEMAQPLKDREFIAAADPKQADVIQMNTCTVRVPASGLN